MGTRSVLAEDDTTVEEQDFLKMARDDVWKLI